MSSQALVRRYGRRNYALGVVNGAFFGFVDAIMAPSLVLALFVAQLGGSNFLVGLLPAIYNGGWFLPQLLAAHWLAGQPLKKGMYVSTAVIRIACWALIVLVTFFLGNSQHSLLLVLFFIPFVAYSFTSGFSGNAFMTIVGKTIPAQRRGSFFGVRDLTGTAAGILAGYLISLALGSSLGLAFPYNFGLLFAITFVAISIGLIVFMFVVEPREKVSGETSTFAGQLRAAGRLWRGDAMFRRYLSTRVVLAVADVATPFYAIFATRRLGAPESIAGLFVGLTTLSAMLSNPAWSWISDHRGTRPLMLSAAAGALAMPAVALAISFGGANPLLVTPFGLVFVVYGTARTAANISFPTYLLEIAPPAERTLYIGLTNTMLGIATFIPAVGGILLDLTGFPPLFFLSLLIASFGLLLATGLVEPRRAA